MEARAPERTLNECGLGMPARSFRKVTNDINELRIVHNAGKQTILLHGVLFLPPISLAST